MTNSESEHSLRTRQYADDANLSRRISLHRRFSVNREPWYSWLFGQLDLSGEPQVVDVGCGNGGLWHVNQGRLPPLRATLCDFSEGMLIAASRAVDLGSGAFTLVQAHAAKLPFVDGSFDVVLANHMLYHVQQVDQAVEELHRVLRADGLLCASTNGPTHLRELDSVAAAVGLATLGDHSEVFSLSSGPDRLARLFRDVKVIRYPNRLEVTDAHAAVDYIASTAEPTPSQSGELLRLVQARIEARGHFRVTIESGLITGRRAA